MAESWIKMRASLLTNPKVIRTARALLADPLFQEWFGVTLRHECHESSVTCHETGVTTGGQNVTSRHAQRHAIDVAVVTRVTVGALLPLWAQANEGAAEGGVLPGASLFEIDTISGVPGLGSAMQKVGWIAVLPNEEGVQFVNFEEHNTTSKERSTGAKTAAERQAESRLRKKLKAADLAASRVTNPDVTERDEKRDASRDTVTTEKSREEKKEEPNGSVGSLPACPTQPIVDLYHEVLPELPRCRLMSDKRRRALATFWRWVLTSKKSDDTRRAQTADQALTWIRAYFERARDNDFLMGRTPRSGEHANWQCDLEFLLTERGRTHVIEKTKEAA